MVTAPADTALESVDITPELEQRPARQPDHAAENRALVVLAERMATAPKDVLEKLVGVALELCRAQSAGVSVAEKLDGEAVFRWQATTGALAGLAGGTLRRAESPCRGGGEGGQPMLFRPPGRGFPPPAAAPPALAEALPV